MYSKVTTEHDRGQRRSATSAKPVHANQRGDTTGRATQSPPPSGSRSQSATDEGRFNVDRLHGQIGHLPPIEFEQRYYRQNTTEQEPQSGEPSLH